MSDLQRTYYEDLIRQIFDEKIAPKLQDSSLFGFKIDMTSLTEVAVALYYLALYETSEEQSWVRQEYRLGP